VGFKQNSITIFKNTLKLSDYSSLTLEAKEVIDYTIAESLKANSVLRLRGLLKSTIAKPKKDNLWFLSWSDIIELRIAIAEENIFEVLRIVFDINEKEFAKIELLNAFSVYKWISEQYFEIAKIEVQELASEMTDEEKEAGAEDMQEFGYSVMLDSIAQGDLLKYDEYLKLPYAKVFRKMCMEKKRHDINKQMQENASRKSRRNS
jgi:hypothetical protein